MWTCMGVRHLANTLEPSMCGGDAACCKITLTTYYLNSFHIVCLHADCEDIKGGLVQTHCRYILYVKPGDPTVMSAIY